MHRTYQYRGFSIEVSVETDFNRRPTHLVRCLSVCFQLFIRHASFATRECRANASRASRITIGLTFNPVNVLHRNPRTAHREWSS